MAQSHKLGLAARVANPFGDDPGIDATTRHRVFIRVEQDADDLLPADSLGVLLVAEIDDVAAEVHVARVQDRSSGAIVRP